MHKSIVLVGLMGAGKTSVGRRLAEMLSAPFWDSDAEIEAASAGISIPEIFERFGEEEFRRLERSVLARLLSGPPAVIATGGGAFMQPQVRDAIAQSGVSIWLDVDLPTLKSRVLGRSGRPLLAVDDPGARLAALLAERGPVYSTADITIAAGQRQTQDDVAHAIIEALRTQPAEPILP